METDSATPTYGVRKLINFDNGKTKNALNQFSLAIIYLNVVSDVI